MFVTKVSPFTGEVHTMEIPCTTTQMDQWADGELIQNVMPNLSASEREFLMTGITPEEWDKYVGSE